ncbi:hypothetical protein [Membranihabitans marinus]|uniref:hypothetical protein n=1 Tax=Membranihabitans marinus TaxID=1227546 RepID=UPI001F41FEFD|nr:hypothetical protein [Membranihabitans marinus]
MNINLYSVLILGIVMCFSCKNEGTGTSQTSNNSESHHESFEYLGSGTPKYTLTTGETTDEYNDAKMTGWNYENGRLSFDIEGNGYELKQQSSDASSLMCANSNEGAHIHVLLDKAPYVAKYEDNFEFDIPDGQHHILAFLGKSYHESIKNSSARIARLIDVVDGKVTNEWNIPTPALFYSRPKGTYVGKDAEKILIDFYPLNIAIGEDAKIKLQVNGEQYYLYDWKPYFIEGLPAGTNSVGIQLLDMNGMPLPTPIGSFLRNFEIIKDPAKSLQ